MTLIVIRSHVPSIGPVECSKVAAALTLQVARDFAQPQPLGWGALATVKEQHEAAHQKPDYILGLFEHPDQPGALGYHDRNFGGIPFMKVFPLLDPSQPWSVTASHEVLECLADPEGSICAQAPDSSFWAVEVCDPVEADNYDIGGVLVSNFVLPCYFQPTHKNPKLDLMGLVKFPFEIRAGGYSQMWDPVRGWVQHLPGEVSAYRKAVRFLGRNERRRASHLSAIRL